MIWARSVKKLSPSFVAAGAEASISIRLSASPVTLLPLGPRVPDGDDCRLDEKINNIEFQFRLSEILVFEVIGEVCAAMMVCHCAGVSDREIRRAVRNGALSVHQIARSCAAGCAPVVATA